MQYDCSHWPDWARRINHWGLGNVVAYTLEAAGPLAIFGAQFIYLGQPFLKQVFSDGQMLALAGLLEDSVQREDFAAYLLGKEPE